MTAAFLATWPIWGFIAAMTVLGLWLCAGSAGEHDYPERDRRES